ncbi:MAG: DUF929 family protein, partial [Candidatus Micrarchaeota archaeon]|nr:DUF929 family protein [Candidatus Micrarchaeota archaeon]
MPTKKKNAPNASSATQTLQNAIRTTRMIAMAAFGISIIAILIGLVPLATAYLKGPAPNFGHTLALVNQPISASQLAVINNASASYFSTAGAMYLNGTLPNAGVQATAANAFILNGKPSVLYLGAISCIYCGENRWAMALALGRFGNFSSIYNGYSSFGDGDLPTLYWLPAALNDSSAVNFGSNYSSRYINFLPVEYISPIKAGFEMQSLPYFVAQANATKNAVYLNVTKTFVALNSFQGTPYTLWGRSIAAGADAIDFANDTTQLQNMTHAQVFNQLRNPQNTFAWTEYAAADLYIAMT